MIYAAFTLWLFLIIFLGAGLYRLWSQIVRPAWVNWTLLPGTVVSEMAYIFGTLISGGEIRRAKLLDIPGRRHPGRGRGANESNPTAEAAPRLKVIGPIIAAMLAVLACAAAILAVHWLLGKPVISQFSVAGGELRPAALPKSFPVNWAGLWDQLQGQVRLLRRMCETWGELDWFNWRVPLFVYLAACLSVRLAPVSRDMRATLGAVVVIAAVIALIGALSSGFGDLMTDIWPLLTYVWASLLFLLLVTLLVRGVVVLFGVLSGKKAG